MALRAIPLSGTGFWQRLAAEDGVEMWERHFSRPDGTPTILYYIASEMRPDVLRHDTLAYARADFERVRRLQA